MLKKEDVLKVGRLARLKLSEEEANEYHQQFIKILDYFNTLEKVPTDHIEPLVTATPMELFLREDVVTQTNTVEDIIANAPDVAGNLYKVPPVV
ncbi:MAG: Asp-tRNA(Asn)/Glu-tRNA(Gln) amidotransferase subunit GatC [Bdellovibrionaceae bacterium]|nr:Asp-tRNA(Asn)/Glu-tRNA(Gln) amidotransferase subunit GatC [Pseudobdellovibrionaceae bacterium]